MTSAIQASPKESRWRAMRFVEPARSHRTLRRLTGSARCRVGFGHNELRRSQAPPGEKGRAALICSRSSAGPFSPGCARPLPCLLCPRARPCAFGPARAAPGAMMIEAGPRSLSIQEEPAASGRCVFAICEPLARLVFARAHQVR